MEFLWDIALNFEYKNELDTMILFADLSTVYRKCLEDMKGTNASKVSAANLTIKSTNLREQGNKLFKDSPTKNALAAARYYTKAIFAAPLGSEALAMAHANRAMALQQFGLFSEAYDDSTCALEQGYPMHMQHKIILRQGYCALQLGDVTLLKQHLDTLNESTLNNNFAAHVQKLQEGLYELQLKAKNVQAPEQQMALYRDKTKILKSPTKGRFMVASKPIKRNELIFSDRATSFVPSEDVLICQQCASAQLIPFPCYRCSGKVVYCSVKCRNEHKTIHGYECMAYQIGFLPTISDFHLAFRVMLDGIQQVIPFLRSKHTAKEIWHELTDKDSKLLQDEHLEYVQVLHRVAHLDNKPTDMIMMLANNAGMVLGYLSEFTNFFNVFKDTAASRSDWELVIGSLLLRHIVQNGANVIQHSFIGCTETKPLDFNLMDDNLWNGPLHIRRGYLNKKIINTKIDFTANFLYFELMNHSCESSVKLKYTGRYISALAIKKIKSGEEISLNYCEDLEHLKRESLRKLLKESFNFECDCLKCMSVKESQDDYHELHRYKCEYPKCRSIFTPFVSEEPLWWWEDDDDINKLRCTKCNNKQPYLVKCVAKITLLLLSVERAISRDELFKTFKNLDQWLLDKHQLKFTLSHGIITKCFAAYNAGTSFTKKDFMTLAQMCKYMMSFKYEPFQSLYMIPMSYLWDIIALKKYVLKPEEMQEMLKGIETLPEDDLKTVCMNYYNDYLISTTEQ